MLLLLCNGYDPNQEREHLLNLALGERRIDVLRATAGNSLDHLRTKSW